MADEQKEAQADKQKEKEEAQADEQKGTEEEAIFFNFENIVKYQSKRKIIREEHMQKNKLFSKYINNIRNGPHDQRLAYIESLLHSTRKDVGDEKYSDAMYKIATIELVLQPKIDVIQYRTMCVVLSYLHIGRAELSAAMVYAFCCADETDITKRSIALNKESDKLIKAIKPFLEVSTETKKMILRNYQWQTL